ncbi:MAG: NYN domain-containing protein [Puniceicoccales bacterium]|nr:NYN domain-containing protein [Puniceicoccales bacterium]
MKSVKVRVQAVNYLLLDGLNIVHGCTEFRSFLPHNIYGALAELERLSSVLSASNFDEIVLVCDGGALGPMDEVRPQNLRFSVVLTPTGKTADSVIVKLCRRLCSGKGKVRITVVSDDGGLRIAAESFGAEVLSCDLFIRQLHERWACTTRIVGEKTNGGKQLWPGKLGDRVKLPDDF